MSLAKQLLATGHTIFSDYFCQKYEELEHVAYLFLFDQFSML